MTETAAGTPKISVVIATHGRPEQLVNCLRCLQMQTLDFSRFEVIVVDDASPEPLALPSMDEALRVRLTRTDEKSGPGVARNAGVAMARGELLAFTDDDCLPAPDWLEKLWEAYEAHPHAMLGGRLYNAVPEYLGAEASQVISDIVYAWYNGEEGNGRFFSTNNAALPKAEFVEAGCFNPAFRGASEDRDLCDRWRASGRRLQYVPGAVMGHAHRLTLKKFVRQHFHYGQGAAIFHAQRAERKTGRLVDEMPFHKALPGLAWRRLQSERAMRRLSLAMMIGLWQLANASGYAWERLKLARATRRSVHVTGN